MSWILSAHIACGLVAILAGAAAVVAGKGGTAHARAGNAFAAAMLVLGATAAALEPMRSPPGSPVAGIMVCYFVATSWAAARRRDGRTGRFEIAACAAVLAGAAAIAWSGFNGATTPAGRGPIFAFAALCLLAGLLDLNAVLRARLGARQRIARHLWRMCFAFFIATGSFFLGQQKVMPAAVRGSPFLFVLAFAPFAVMLFWLVRLRLAGTAARLSRRASASPSAPQAAPAATATRPPRHPPAAASASNGRGYGRGG